ncbi:MAG: hypothetical protein KIT73_10125 [Burkholderiales bacterium]|nr:hypothetical protein [Burkholderiales bacterium]
MAHYVIHRIKIDHHDSIVAVEWERVDPVTGKFVDRVPSIVDIVHVIYALRRNAKVFAGFPSANPSTRLPLTLVTGPDGRDTIEFERPEGGNSIRLLPRL